MLDRLKIIDERYEEINKLLSDPEVVCDVKRLTELSKEQRGLEKPIMLYREQLKLEDSIPDLKEMKNSDDAEMAEMASLELDEATARIAQIEEEVKILLLPKDPNDEKDVIVEIRGAAGGDEANNLEPYMGKFWRRSLHQRCYGRGDGQRLSGRRP